MMGKVLAIVLLVLGLAACEDMSDVKTATLEEMHEFMYGEPLNPPPPEPRVLDSKYCYKTQTDILCYDSPQPEMDDQFVGAQ